jgi:maleylacetate reductase
MIAATARRLLQAGFSVRLPWARVAFGHGTLAQLPALVDATSAAERVVLVASPRRHALLAHARELLGARVVAVEHTVVPHVPRSLATAVAATVTSHGASLVVTIGGGSAIGMAKAITALCGVPSLAVPTTFSGSEMTPIWGTTADGIKATARDDRVRPLAVIYDPALLADLPPRIAGPSALNAIAHCIGALCTATDATARAVAAEGLSALAEALPGVVAAGDASGTAESPHAEALYGSWLAGMALGASSMGIQHRLAHALGGVTGAVHADVHAVLLPYTTPSMLVAAGGDACRVVGHSLGVASDDADAIGARLHRLLDVVSTAGAPRSLRELGVTEAQREQVAALVSVGGGAGNTADQVQVLLRRAWRGDSATA